MQPFGETALSLGWISCFLFEVKGNDSCCLLLDVNLFNLMYLSQDGSLEVPSGITELVSAPLVSKEEVFYWLFAVSK